MSCEVHHRAPPEIVRARLACKSENGDALRLLVANGLDHALQMGFVRHADRVEQGCHQVGGTRVAGQRAQILRETMAAERQSRAEVRLRRVQLGVEAESLHDTRTLDAVYLAPVADLVRERDLECVERVVGMLRRFSNF